MGVMTYFILNNRFFYQTEIFHMISQINFNYLQINVRRLSSISRLWSFNPRELSPDNNFYKHFVFKLTEITSVVLTELNGEHLVLVSNILLFSLYLINVLTGHKPVEAAQFRLSLQITDLRYLKRAVTEKF